MTSRTAPEGLHRDLPAESATFVLPASAPVPNILAEKPASPADGRAWDDFISRHSSLLLRVAHVVTRDVDSAMDAYAFVLEKLRENGGARLTAYRETSGCSFETWLAVVVRRLCLDHYRAKYGRPRSETLEAREAHAERRRLADLIATSLDHESAAVPDGQTDCFDRAEILRALQQILDDSPPRDRLLLRYRFDDGLSAREIARRMQFPTAFHVYRRLSSLLTVCRRELQQRGFRASDV